MSWLYTRTQLPAAATSILKTMAARRSVLVVDAGVRVRAGGGPTGVQVLFRPIWVHAGTGLLLKDPPEEPEDTLLAAAAFWSLEEGWLDEHAGACPANRAVLMPTAVGADHVGFGASDGRYFSRLTKRCAAVSPEGREALGALQAKAQAALGSWGIVSHEEGGAWHSNRFPASVPLIYPLGTTRRERSAWKREVFAERRRVLRRVTAGLNAAYGAIQEVPFLDA